MSPPHEEMIACAPELVVNNVGWLWAGAGNKVNQHTNTDWVMSCIYNLHSRFIIRPGEK